MLRSVQVVMHLLSHNALVFQKVLLWNSPIVPRHSWNQVPMCVYGCVQLDGHLATVSHYVRFIFQFSNVSISQTYISSQQTNHSVSATSQGKLILEYF